jgi:hypothetical protein
MPAVILTSHDVVQGAVPAGMSDAKKVQVEKLPGPDARRHGTSLLPPFHSSQARIWITGASWDLKAYESEPERNR